MKSIIKICSLENENEANLMAKYLNEEGIPHSIKSNIDSAYNGLWKTQFGWGYIEAPEKFKNSILEIYNDLKK